MNKILIISGIILMFSATILLITQALMVEGQQILVSILTGVINGIGCILYLKGLCEK